MSTVCLSTAITLTGLSKRTLWRRVADGTLTSLPSPGETRLPLDQVRALMPFSLSDDELALVLAADAGEPPAQCDLGWLLLEHGLAAEALTWMERAAKAFFPDAMHTLGRCLIAGQGAEADRRAGAEWLCRAADQGYAVSRPLAAWLRSGAADTLSAADCDAALDALERERVFAALRATADKG